MQRLSGSGEKSIVCCIELIKGVVDFWPGAFIRSLLRLTRMRFVASAEPVRPVPPSISYRVSAPGVLAPVSMASGEARRVVNSVAA